MIYKGKVVDRATSTLFAFTPKEASTMGAIYIRSALTAQGKASAARRLCYMLAALFLHISVACATLIPICFGTSKCSTLRKRPENISGITFHFQMQELNFFL